MALGGGSRLSPVSYPAPGGTLAAVDFNNDYTFDAEAARQGFYLGATSYLWAGYSETVGGRPETPEERAAREAEWLYGDERPEVLDALERLILKQEQAEEAEELVSA